MVECTLALRINFGSGWSRKVLAGICRPVVLTLKGTSHENQRKIPKIPRRFVLLHVVGGWHDWLGHAIQLWADG
jgi:hypothetical protein